MDFNETLNTACIIYRHTYYDRALPRVARCAQRDVIMTSEFVYIGATMLLTRQSSSGAPA